MKDFSGFDGYTVCPRSGDPFYVVSYYIKWLNTSWTHNMYFFSPYQENKNKNIAIKHYFVFAKRLNPPQCLPIFVVHPLAL